MSYENIVEPSYIVFVENGKYLARNGMTGEIEFNNANAATVINAAIAALTSGGKISFKAGTYTLDDTIFQTDYIKLCGAGRDLTILVAAAGFSGALIETDNIGVDTIESPTIRDMTLDGNNLAVPLIDYMGRHPLIENVTLQDDGGTTGTHCSLRLRSIAGGTPMARVRTLYVLRAGWRGIWVDSSDGFFSLIQINTCGDYGMLIDGGDNYIDKPHIFYCANHGISFGTGSDRSGISGGQVENNAKRALHIAGDQVKVEGVNFYRNGYGTPNSADDIYIYNAHGVIVDGCNFYDFEDQVRWNINLVDSDHCVLSNNTHSDPTTGAMILNGGCDDNYIDNPTYLGTIPTKITDGGVRTRINGLGREASGGGAPTAANWDTGDIVQDTDNPANHWVLDYDGTFRQIA